MTPADAPREWRRETPVMPRGPMIGIAAGWVGAVGIFALTGHLAPALPLLGVLGYAVVGGLSNGIRVRVSREGVHWSYGPIPFSPMAPIEVARERIAFVYFRAQFVSGRWGGGVAHTAGVQTADGKWIDLATVDSLEEARRQATEWGEILQAPVRQVSGRPPHFDWKAEWPGLAWSGVILATMIAGVVLHYTLAR